MRCEERRRDGIFHQIVMGVVFEMWKFNFICLKKNNFEYWKWHYSVSFCCLDNSLFDHDRIGLGWADGLLYFGPISDYKKGGKTYSKNFQKKVGFLSFSPPRILLKLAVGATRVKIYPKDGLHLCS
jgi:hypothetical protein